MSVEQIIAEGTTVHFNPDRESAKEWMVRKSAKPSNTILCVDGFSMSVIAGSGTYCAPRPGQATGTPYDYEGPFAAVEVGYPSERPEPWSDWAEYCEDPGEPTNTVYGYVPVAMVRALIDLHGGEV